MAGDENHFRAWLFRIHREAASDWNFRGAYRIKIGVKRGLGKAIFHSLPRTQREVIDGKDAIGRPTKQLILWGITVEWLDDPPRRFGDPMF